MVKQTKVRSRVLVTRNVLVSFRSQADYNDFIEWFEDDINGGADWFNWTNPETSATVLARIVSGLEQEQPENAHLADWVIRFKMETWGA